MSLLIVFAEDHELESPSLVLVELSADLCQKVVEQRFHFVLPVALGGPKLLFHVVLPAVDSAGVGILQCHAVSFLF